MTFSLNAKIGEQIDNLEELTRNHYIYGLKYNTFADRHNPEDIQKHPKLLESIRENDLPLLIYGGSKTPISAMNIYELAKKLPDIRICAAHAGRFSKSFFKRCAEEPLPNLYVDTSPFINLHSRLSTPGYNDSDTIECDRKDAQKALQYVCGLLPNNMIWGTDAPYTYFTDLSKKEPVNKVISYKDEANLLKRLEPGTIKAIASRNTLDFLFGILPSLLHGEP
jgi:predicted TIM-barrel fold metal-dependent hydrolase